MKFNRVFAPHLSFRFDESQLKAFAEDIVYVCGSPYFDDIKDEHSRLFEGQIADKLKDFDPKNDCIAFYGDPMIYALMVAYLAPEHDKFYVARYSRKEEAYVIRQINQDLFE